MAESANLVHVEIFGLSYAVRGADAAYVEQLAAYVDEKMREVSRTSGAVDSVRVAVLAALNIADEYHILKRKYDGISKDMNQRTSSLENALDEVLQESRRAG